MKINNQRRFLNGVMGLLLPVALVICTSCSSTKPPAWKSGTSTATSPYHSSENFGGEITTDAVTSTATVASVDHANRQVVLKRADGHFVTYQAVPEAIGFNDIQRGDVVKVSVAEEIAVFLGKNTVPASAGRNPAKLRVRLPHGAQAVATEVGTVGFTAKITALDDWADTVTLQLADGSSKTIKVSEYVNLADVKVGDIVSVRSTESAVLMLEK